MQAKSYRITRTTSYNGEIQVIDSLITRAKKSITVGLSSMMDHISPVLIMQRLSVTQRYLKINLLIEIFQRRKQNCQTRESLLLNWVSLTLKFYQALQVPWAIKRTSVSAQRKRNTEFYTKQQNNASKTKHTLVKPLVLRLDFKTNTGTK